MKKRNKKDKATTIKSHKKKLFFANRTVKGKLDFMAKMMIGAIIVLGISTSISVYKLNQQTRELSDRRMVVNTIVSTLEHLISEYRLKQYAHVISSKRVEFDRYEQQMEEILEKIDQLLLYYEGMISSDQEREYYEAAYQGWNTYLESTGEQLISLSRSMEVTQANSIMLEHGYEAFEGFQQSFNELIIFNNNEAVRTANQAQIIFVVILVVVVILVILSIITGMTISKSIISGITNPIHQLMGITDEMAKGNLSVSVDYEAADEFGVLATSMKQTQNILLSYVKEISDTLTEIAKGNLTVSDIDITNYLGDFGTIKDSLVYILEEFNDVLYHIQEMSVQVTLGSAELEEAANMLAQGTMDQASSIEELTAIIHTVSNMAETEAKNSQDSYHQILQAVKSAQMETEQMQELKQEMNRIMEISNEIAEIVTTIQQISSKTSLLSLNASIEAARAGVAGKGFTVVADQIGKLASDSAEAVVNTKELIEKTIEEIEKGYRVTDRTVEGFERIIEELERFAEVSKHSHEISMAQATSLGQVEIGIEQINEVTEKNTNASEKCSAISEQLVRNVTDLDEMVKHFTLRKR